MLGYYFFWFYRLNDNKNQPITAPKKNGGRSAYINSCAINKHFALRQFSASNPPLLLAAFSTKPMTDKEIIQEHEALDNILKYLIDNRSDNPIHCKQIWTDLFPEIEQHIIYYLLKKLIGNDIVSTVIKDIDIEDFSVFFGANDLTKYFLIDKGGFTALSLKDQSDKIEQDRIVKLQTEKLEAEVDIIKFEKGLGRRFLKWTFIVTILSFLVSLLTVLYRDQDNSIYNSKVDSLIQVVSTSNYRVDSLTYDLKQTKQQLQNLELQLSKDTQTSN